MIALLLAAVALANVRQPFPALAPLQHAPTVVLALASPWLLRHWPLSDGAVGCAFAFLLLHTFAGRYIYSEVPYDAWGRALTGVSIDRLFGFGRNMFDRLVHFSFGLLAVPLVREILARHCGVGRRLAGYVAIEFVLAISCLYEIFEWLLTVVMAGPNAAAYNGQQGDLWDAQKDMAMATLGALLATVVLVIRARPRSRGGA